MNSTIKQYSGPSSSSQAKGLPKAAKKFAQQMGLDLTGLEAEAEDMWEMLNKMSVEEPLAYENFVEEQMRQQKEESTNTEGENKKGRMFRPKAGFCIKCRTTGNDGIKVRDFGAKSGKDFYLNFVSHEAIEPPKDKNGKPVLDDRGASADGLELPLLIGPSRDVDDSTMAADVVVHPVIIARCESYNLFKTQVIDLALEWTTQEIGVQYQKKYETVPWNYHGGRGADKSTPVFFPVDEVLERQAGGPSTVSKDNLLDTIKVEKQKDALLEMASSSNSIDNTPQIRLGKENNKKKSIGIQEMREDGTFEPPVVEPLPEKDIVSKKKKSKKKKDTPAVKKGFLNTNSKSLYPEGSSEGQNGGVYTRLMSRCQVVDTAKLPPSSSGENGNMSSGGPEIQSALPIPPKQPTTQQVPTSVSEKKNPFNDSSVPTSSQSLSDEVGTEKPSALSVNEQREVDDMFSGLDDDFATSLTMEKKSFQADELMTQQFADFAKALSGPIGANRDKDEGLENFVKEMSKKGENPLDSAPSSGTNPVLKDSDAAIEPACKVKNKLSKHISFNVEISNEETLTKREARICIGNLDKSQLKEADLQVSQDKIVVVIPPSKEKTTLESGGGSVQIVPPFSCNVKSVKASMSKKKKAIEIVVPEQ